MNVGAALKTNPELGKPGEPGQGPLDHPAMPAQALGAFNPTAGDPWLDAVASQMMPAAWKVVALVSVQFVRPSARPSRQAGHRRQRIDQGFEHHGIVALGAADRDSQWNAPRIDNHMALGAEFAPVGGIGAGLLAPRGLGTAAESMLARCQSI